jgi:hypothetical protein
MAQPAIAMTKRESLPDPTPWRMERVFVVPHGKGFQVVPPNKVVSKGQIVTFRAFDCKRLEFGELDERVFGRVEYDKDDPTLVTVQVRADAPSGFHPYSVLCEPTVALAKKWKSHRKVEARGMSSPGMIVDP